MFLKLPNTIPVYLNKYCNQKGLNFLFAAFLKYFIFLFPMYLDPIDICEMRSKVQNCCRNIGKIYILNVNKKLFLYFGGTNNIFDKCKYLDKRDYTLEEH